MKCNKNMGGIDKNNCLVSLYRTPTKSRRWYLPLFFYFLDMCIVNAWLLDKKEMIRHEQLSLKEFRLEVARGLLQHGKQKRGRASATLVNKKINAPRSQRPDDLIRYDGVGHWPTFNNKRMRCKHCNGGKSKILCCKCNVALCQNANNNCFYAFHNNNNPFVMEEKTDSLYNARLRKVRRRLFQDDGDSDEQQKREDTDNRFSEEMRIQLEQNMKKWNFDFVSGKPRSGRYEWVKLDEQGNEISESEETNGRIDTQEKCAEGAENKADSFDKSMDETIKAAKESNCDIIY